MVIPPGADGSQPALCGCMLESIYKAVQLHFHWGSPHSEGSEHQIEFSRYDAEMHIVHQNCAYGTKKEALCAPDGYVVLGLMLKIAAVSNILLLLIIINIIIYMMFLMYRNL